MMCNSSSGKKKYYDGEISFIQWKGKKILGQKENFSY